MSCHVSRRGFVAIGLSFAASTVMPAFSAAQEDLATLTLKQAADMLRRRDASPVELTEACLKRIELYDRSINAFITVTREQALSAAFRSAFRSAAHISGRLLSLRSRTPMSRRPNGTIVARS